ncbi:signal peptidase I [Streptomyces sp. NBC_01020]|uniref:signal peptidase I n=1 Tax=unclassified Streptomyces TaxID=2593676 RepID=UPI0032449B77|nr:signal peptidase I [Streptomyces sp. NBC_01020]WSX69157.1 signal peptidase I [Streptomyces sp. NBC_00932]
MGAGRGLTVTGWVLGSLGVVLLAAGALWGFRGYESVSVNDDSMVPAYAKGDRVAIEKSDGGGLHHGEVVLYRTPDRYDGADALQRVIALGGDHLVFDGKQLVLNGEPLDEPYLDDGDEGASDAYDVLVPHGRMFTLGDNRADALDSRNFLADQSGTLPVKAVRGRLIDNPAMPLLLAVSVLAGTLLALAGAGFGLAGRVVRRRRLAALTPYGQSSSRAQSRLSVRR